MSQGASIKDGKRLAKETKERWLNSLIEGEVSFQAVVEMSRDAEGVGRYLSKLRLLDVLSARRGWTKITAVEALQRIGLSERDNLQSIRRSTSKIQRFALLMESTADRWRARPQPPKGWPWSGKLSVLVRESGEELPPELEAVMSEDDGDDEQVLSSFLKD